MFYLIKKGNMKRLLIIGVILSLFIFVGASPPTANTDTGYNVECATLDVDVEMDLVAEIDLEMQILEPFVEVEISYGNSVSSKQRYNELKINSHNNTVYNEQSYVFYDYEAAILLLTQGKSKVLKGRNVDYYTSAYSVNFNNTKDIKLNSIFDFSMNKLLVRKLS